MDYREIDINKIEYSKPRKINGKYIGKIRYIDNDEAKEIKVKSPYLRCITSIVYSENRCYLELELDVDDKDFYEFLADLDDINITTAFENSKVWFGEQFPIDIIDDYYKPYVRLHSKLKHPYIKVKIPYDGKKIKIKEFNEGDFKYGNLVSITMQYDGLRFFKQQFTSEWSMVGYDVENQYEFDSNLEIAENVELLDDMIRNGIDDKGDENNKEEEKEEKKMMEEKKVEEKGKDKKDEDKKEEKKMMEEKREIKKEEEKRGGEKRKRSKKKIIKYAHKNRVWKNN